MWRNDGRSLSYPRSSQPDIRRAFSTRATSTICLGKLLAKRASTALRLRPRAPAGAVESTVDGGMARAGCFRFSDGKHISSRHQRLETRFQYLTDPSPCAEGLHSI